jgi:hypothetical protein
MKQPKIGPTEMQAEIARLQSEGKMPTLESVLAAIVDVRNEYRPKILAARKLK